MPHSYGASLAADGRFGCQQARGDEAETAEGDRQQHQDDEGRYCPMV